MQDTNAYDSLVRILTAYTGAFADVRVYPLRTVLVCGECGGCGRQGMPPYGGCVACGTTGYPDGVRLERFK